MSDFSHSEDGIDVEIRQRALAMLQSFQPDDRLKGRVIKQPVPYRYREETDENGYWL